MLRSSCVRWEYREFQEKWASSKTPWVRKSLTCLKDRKRPVWLKYGVGRLLGKDKRSGQVPDHGGSLN